MPVTFNYAAEIPSAPYALVTITRPDGTAEIELPAKVDSGAARTVIPATIADQLKLDVVDRLDFEGLGGQRVTLAIFRVLLTIRGCSALEVNAAASEGEPYILLGRDVLNQFRVVLDGPNGKLVIE